MLKIISVQPFLISIPLKNPKRISTRNITSREYIVVKVTTDNGFAGWGYAFGTQVEFHCIEDLLSKIILLQDATNTEKLWREMYTSTIRWGRRGAMLRSISAIDMALWDIKAKSFGVPLYQLLGGSKKEVKVYISSAYYCGLTGKEDEEFVKADSLSIKERGFKAYKLRVGGGDFKGDLRRVEAARKTLGDDFEIFVDANNAWDTYTAIRFGNELQKLGVGWLEEPVLHDDLHALAKIAEELTIPIAVGELEATRWGFQNIITYKAADILQPDVTVAGGITEWVKIANNAIAQGLMVVPHAFHEWHVHLACALPEISLIEYFEVNSDIVTIDSIFVNPAKAINGYLKCPDEPGLGFIIDEELIKKFHIY